MLMNKLEQAKDAGVLILFFAAVSLLIYGYPRDWLPLQILIMLLALGPLALVNYFMLRSPRRTKEFKQRLVTFSVLFALTFCVTYLWFVPLPSNDKFETNEFGVLFIEFGHWDKNHVDVQRDLAKKIRKIPLADSGGERVVRGLVLPQKEVTHLVSTASVTVVMNEKGAQLAYCCTAIENDSVKVNVLVSQDVITKGFHRESFKLTLSRNQFIELMMDNIRALLEFTDGELPTSTLANKPQRRMASVLISAKHFQQGTRLLAQLGSLPKNDPKYEQIVHEAEAALLNAIQDDPMNDKAYYTLAWINHFCRNDNPHANAFYQKAQSLRPDKFDYAWNLAQHYNLLNQNQAAIQVLRSYLEKYGSGLELSQRTAMELLLSSYQ